MSRLCGRAAATRLSRLCGRAAAMTTWQRPQHLAHGVCRRFVASEASRITIYTKTGDKGRSSLFTGERRRKDDAVFEALGDVDELTVAIGVAREYCSLNDEPCHKLLVGRLTEIQCRLLDVGSYVATPPPPKKENGGHSSEVEAKLQRTSMQSGWVTGLETWIDEMDRELPALTNFILPSGGLSSLSLHQARSICRRAERRVVAAEGALERGGGGEGGKGERGQSGQVTAAVYLNRLSDFLFVAARYSAQAAGREETIYKRSPAK